MSATEMAAFGIAQIPWAATTLGLVIANYKRDKEHTAWFADRTRVVAPPKAPKDQAQPENRDARGYLRDANGRFAPRNGAVDLAERRAG